MKTDKISLGQQYEYEVDVTYEMRASFGEVTVHELYSTAAMLNHMEWAARQHILSALEAGEEGVGAHMEVDHLGPTPIGARVRIIATVTGVTPRQVTCACEAWHEDRKVGQGQVVQAILPLEILRARIPQNRTT